MKIVLLITIFLLIFFSFGCVQNDEVNSDLGKDGLIDNDLDDDFFDCPIVSVPPCEGEVTTIIDEQGCTIPICSELKNNDLVDEEIIDSNLEFEKFLESICYYNDNFFDYFEINDISRRVDLAFSDDFNAHGACFNNWDGGCFQAAKYDVFIGEDKIFVEKTTHVFINKPMFYIIESVIPKNYENYEFEFNSRIIRDVKTVITNDFDDLEIPLNFDKKIEFVMKNTTVNLRSGKNVFIERYSYEYPKECRNNVCIVPLNFFIYDEQASLLNVESDFNILNDYLPKVIGRGSSQLIAISKEPTFNVGKLHFSESQRYFYNANKKAIDWVADRIDMAENIVGQKTPEKIFIFFTNSVRSETSFTYKRTGLIIMMGDIFGDAFEEVLFHEIHHQAVTNIYWPRWLDEAIAQYVSYKYMGYEIPFLENNDYIIASSDNSYDLAFIELDNYNYSANIIQNFINKYGCDSFNDFLFELNDLSSNLNSERNVVENALKNTIGDFSYEDLINNKI